MSVWVALLVGLVIGVALDAVHRRAASRGISAEGDFGVAFRQQFFGGLNDDQLERIARSCAAEMQKRPDLAEAWDLEEGKPL